MDNAIEAASSSKEKKIAFEILNVPVFDTSKPIVNIIIENSYSNKDIDISRISEKGFTSKSEASRFAWARSMESCKYFKKI